jgi:hypothetical protein
LSALPDRIHLVGSIGLDTAQEVFRTVGRAFGPRLKRVPDGEPGPRRLWVSFQYPFLRSSPYLRPDPSGAVRKTSGFPLLCLAEGVKPAEVRFGELGYAREARASYQDFCEARSRGDIAKGARFQVCLPTPMGVIYAFCTARDIEAIEAAYEAAMIREVKEICRTIPRRRRSSTTSCASARRSPTKPRSGFISAMATSAHATSSNRPMHPRWSR